MSEPEEKENPGRAAPPTGSPDVSRGQATKEILQASAGASKSLASGGLASLAVAQPTEELVVASPRCCP
jgi:hypothetical protein